MLNERQMKIKLSLIHGIELKKGFIPEEKEIINKIKKLSEIFETPLTEREEEEIKKDILSNYYVQMDVGIRLVEEKPTPWYFSAKANIKNFFWDRYLTYLLDEGFSPNVINTLDKVSDELMDSLGNPNSSLDFARRGLVIGDVQSGKTSTYLALINKAADAGYKVIIILTGTIERLRKQTQERVDLGFIGLDKEHIEGIFVKEKSKGIGKELIDIVKQNKNELSLHVYQKNKRAIDFYKKQGFHITEESVDEATNEKEYLMKWVKER